MSELAALGSEFFQPYLDSFTALRFQDANHLIESKQMRLQIGKQLLNFCGTFCRAWFEDLQSSSRKLEQRTRIGNVG